MKYASSSWRAMRQTEVVRCDLHFPMFSTIGLLHSNSMTIQCCEQLCPLSNFDKDNLIHWRSVDFAKMMSGWAWWHIYVVACPCGPNISRTLVICIIRIYMMFWSMAIHALQLLI